MALADGHAPSEDCILDDLSVFKFWRIQKPNAAKLLKEIIFRWRGASAYVRGKPGKWVVWPRERWCEWTGLSRNQLDRALKELVESDLIHRERHRFAGSEVRTFLRPTLVALKHLGRPQDIAQAVTMAGSEGAAEKPIENCDEKSSKEISDNSGEKASEKTDYTSIPSFSITPTSTTFSTETIGQVIPGDQEGKGKAGEEDMDEDDKIIAKFKAKKKAKDEKMFPEKVGKHQQCVKHPSAMFPKWGSFSQELKAKLYAQYLDYVDNWTNGKKAKSIIDDDDWAEISAKLSSWDSDQVMSSYESDSQESANEEKLT